MVKQAVCKYYYRRERGGAQLNCLARQAHARRARGERKYDEKKKKRREKKKKKRISNNVISDRAIRLTSRKSSSQWPLTRDIHASTLTQQHSSSVGPCSNSQLFFTLDKFGRTVVLPSLVRFSFLFFIFRMIHSLKFRSQDSLNYFCKYYLLLGRRRHFVLRFITRDYYY